MELENLYRAHQASRKHNRRSEDMIAFELDLYANLRSLCDKVNSRSYIPLHNYSFMHRRNQKAREVFAAEPELKILMTYALMRITPLVEKHLSSRTFNNRVGMGASLAVNTLIKDIYEVSKGYTSPCWIIKIDYKGYFPNMRQDYAWEIISDIVKKEYLESDKGDVLYCLHLACFCNASKSVRKSPLWDWSDYPGYKSVYRREDGTGGLIGFTFWQSIAGLYPTAIDRFVEKNISRRFVRYVDDTVIVTDNKEMVLSMLPSLRVELKKIGITLHPKKFYCQPCEHGVEFLGYHIRPRRLHLKRTTLNRAFFVSKSRERGKNNFFSAMNSYLGMIKSSSDINIAKRLLDAITRKGYEKDYQNLKLIMI